MVTRGEAMVRSVPAARGRSAVRDERMVPFAEAPGSRRVVGAVAGQGAHLKGRTTEWRATSPSEPGQTEAWPAGAASHRVAGPVVKATSVS